MIKSMPPYIRFFTLIALVDPYVLIASVTARARLWLFSLTQGTDAFVCRYLALNSSIELEETNSVNTDFVQWGNLLQCFQQS